MKKISYAFASLAMAVAVPLAAFAQASNVTITAAPSTNTYYSPGTSAAALGTVTLTATNGSASVSSIPLSLATNGASVGGIGNCTLVNQNGTNLTTGAHVIVSPSQGLNSFNLDQPLSVSAGSPMVLTVRCDIAASGNYQFFAQGQGTATSTPGTASLGASILTFPTVAAGTTAAPIASIMLTTNNSGVNVNVSSIPLIATYSNGLVSTNFSNCRLRNAGTAVNANSAGIVAAGSNTIAFDNPVMISGTAAVPTSLVLTCDVGAAPAAGTIGLSIDPTQIVATNASTGAAVTPTTSTTNGTANPVFGTVTVAAASTGTNTGTNTGTGTGTTGGTGTNTGGPGVPNTGAGANAATTYAVILLALFVAGVSAIVLLRARRV